MTKTIFNCDYCGHKFEASDAWLKYFDDEEGRDGTCPRCGDKHCKARDIETYDVFGYKEKK